MLKEILSKTKEVLSSSFDDQEAMHKTYISNKDLFALDYHADLFMSMYLSCDDIRTTPIPESEERGGLLWFNSITNRYPGLLHFNGMASCKYIQHSSGVCVCVCVE